MKEIIKSLVVTVSLLFVGGCSSLSTLLELKTDTAVVATHANTDAKAQFTEKVAQANIGGMILSDKEYIGMMLDFDEQVEAEVTDRKAFDACVFDEIQKQEYGEALKTGTDKLLQKRPHAFELWNSKIDFLVMATNKIYYDPKEVEFDTDNIAQSSALTLFTSEQAAELVGIIENKEFAPLLGLIGLPKTLEDGTVKDTVVYQLALASTVLVEKTDICLKKTSQAQGVE